MNAVELELQMGVTRAFILADAEDLVLYRRPRISDGAGGYKFGLATPLAAQTVRLIPQNDTVPELTGLDGRLARPELVILMEPGGDMQRYDKFIWRGRVWEIGQVHDKPDYEMKGDVIPSA